MEEKRVAKPTIVVTNGIAIYDIHAKKFHPDNAEEMAQGLDLIAAAKSCSSLKHFVFQIMTGFETTPENRGLDP